MCDPITKNSSRGRSSNNYHCQRSVWSIRHLAILQTKGGLWQTAYICSSGDTQNLESSLYPAASPACGRSYFPGSRVLAKCGWVAVAARIPVDVSYKVALESSVLTKSRLLSKALGIQSVIVVAEKR
jgi:hypothetical protein